METTKAGKLGRGFTLIELIAVAVITTIIAAVAIPALSSMAVARGRVAARMVQRDLTFARERALATGIVHWVAFTPVSDTYSVLSENPSSPGRSGAAAISDPATGAPMLVRLNTGDFAGVDLTATSFAGGAEVGFDWLGRPKAMNGAVLGSAGTVTLSGGYTVTVAVGGISTWAGP